MDWAHVITSRTAVEARVFVTDRMKPLRVEDHVVHQIWMPYRWGSAGLVDGDVVNDLLGVVADPNVFIQESKVATCDIQPGRRPRGPALLEYVAEYRRRAGITQETGTRVDTTRPDGVAHAEDRHEREQLLRTSGRPGRQRRIRRRHPPRVGFFTDTSVWIGCKACEVACKEWNGVPDDGFNLLGMSFDNTGELGANTWRHVAFIEQPERPPVDLGMPGLERPGDTTGSETRQDFRWLMSSDVCKHCTHAAVWTCARRARCSAPSSAQWLCSKTSATDAAIACRAARTG